MKKILFILIFFILPFTYCLTGCESKEEKGDTMLERSEDKIQRSQEAKKEENTELEERRYVVEEPDPRTADGGLVMTHSEVEGMKLFMKNCNRCHPGGEKGKGPSLNDKPLPNFFIHLQIRVGVGDMPSFKKDELSKENIQDIIAFVKLMRQLSTPKDVKKG